MVLNVHITDAVSNLDLCNGQHPPKGLGANKTVEARKHEAPSPRVTHSFLFLNPSRLQRVWFYLSLRKQVTWVAIKDIPSILFEFIVQELCESRGELSVLTSLLVSVDVKNY